MKMIRVHRKRANEHAHSVHEDHVDDCVQIRNVAAERLGWDITLSQAEYVWSEHSEMYSASWMILYDRAEVVQALVTHLEPISEEDEPVGWKPTLQLRWATERDSTGLGPEFETHENEYYYFVLQQRWVNGDESEWRDVPYGFGPV